MIRVQHLGADVLALTPLARDALAARVSAAGVPIPRSLAVFPRPEDRHEPRERTQLARRLEAALAPLKPHVAVLDALRSLAQPGAACVVTGQQPGFLCAPLYSLYKALQALRLARLLRERWGTPVVALFWNHADDHDLAEVHHAYIVNRNLDLQRVGLAGMSSGRRPLSQIVLSREEQRLDAVRALLEQSLRGEPHAEQALELFMPRDGESLPRAFTRSITELLGHLGLVVIEPDWIRDEISRALAHIVARDPLPALVRGAEELRTLGREVAIDPPEAALVYRHDERGRNALRAGGDGFRYDDEPGSRTPSELAAEIVQEPQAWSPGALLRPLVQDIVLPSCAYVGGFGELAYHLGLGPVRELAGAPPTPFVPRVSCTLVDAASRSALDRLGLELADVLAGGVQALDNGETGSPAVSAKMRAIAERAGHELGLLRDELAALDPSLAANARRTADQLRALVDKLAGKAERVHQNRTGKGRRHVRRLSSTLFPLERPQERVLGPLPYVARFGTGWIDELCAEIDPLAPDHLAVLFDAGPADEDET